MTVYAPILTTIGASKLANAIATATPLVLTEMSVGDGGGSVPVLNPAQTQLINETFRDTINSIELNVAQDGVNVELVIPAYISGGYTVREVGVWDEDGDLIAVSTYPPSYKPTVEEGATKDFLIRVVLEVGNAEAIELVIDPSVIVATRTWVEQYLVGTTVPTGFMMPFAGSASVPGFLVCNGAIVSRTTYANLFLVIGTTYGAGNGTTTFQIPTASVAGINYRIKT